MKEIIIHNFTVKRGSFTLYPLSLTIEKGEIFAILGRTGSGKTVLLEAIGVIACWFYYYFGCKWLYP